MHDAKSNLSSLVREVREGSEREIIICLSGQPVDKAAIGH
jgi:antitoxin (DNA-binding transcriptional repressor) of toxin-antitoxin stability system